MVLVINYLGPYITRRSHNALAATLIALRTVMHKVSVPNVSPVGGREKSFCKASSGCSSRLCFLFFLFWSFLRYQTGDGTDPHVLAQITFHPGIRWSELGSLAPLKNPIVLSISCWTSPSIPLSEPQ